MAVTFLDDAPAGVTFLDDEPAGTGVTFLDDSPNVAAANELKYPDALHPDIPTAPPMSDEKESLAGMLWRGDRPTADQYKEAALDPLVSLIPHAAPPTDESTILERAGKIAQNTAAGLSDFILSPAGIVTPAAAALSPLAGAAIATGFGAQGLKDAPQAALDIKNAKTPQERDAAIEQFAVDALMGLGAKHGTTGFAEVATRMKGGRMTPKERVDFVTERQQAELAKVAPLTAEAVKSAEPLPTPPIEPPKVEPAPIAAAEGIATPEAQARGVQPSGEPVAPADIVPAIRVNGQLIEGTRGETHQDILNRHIADNPEQAADAFSNFDTKENPNFFRGGNADISREQLKTEHGVSDSQGLRDLQKADTAAPPPVATPAAAVPDVNAQGIPIGPGKMTEGELGPQKKIGGYNADVEASQKARGQTPTISEARKEDPVTFERAMDAIEKDPNLPEKLVEDIHRDPKKPITDEQQQMLTYRRAELENKMAAESERAIDTSLSPEDQASHQSNAELFESQLLRAEEANRMAGTASGRSLRSRQLEMNDDYTFAGLMMRRRKATGEVVTPEERAIIKAQAEEIAGLRKIAEKTEAVEAEGKFQAAKVSVLESTIADLNKAEADRPKYGQEVLDRAEKIVTKLEIRAEAASKRLRAKFGRTSAGVDPTIVLDVAEIMAARIGRAGLKAAELFRDLTSEYGNDIVQYLEPALVRAKKIIGQTTGGGTRKIVEEGVSKPKKGEKTPAKVGDRAKAEAEAGMELRGKTAYEAVRAAINAGAKGEAPIMASALDILKPHYPELTLRQLDEKFTDYGNAKHMSQEQTAVQLRKQRQLRQMILKIQDLEKTGKAPRFGVTRDKPDADVRLRIKELKAAVDKFSKDIPDTPEMIAGREATAIRAKENAIERLDRQLKGVEQEIAKTPREQSQKVEQLQSQLDAMRELKRELDDAANPPPPEHITELAKLQDRVDETRDRLARMELERPKVEGKPTADTKEIAAAKEDLKTLNDTIRDLRKPIPLSDAQKALDSALVARERVAQTLDDISTGKLKDPVKIKEALTRMEEDVRMETDSMKALAAEMRRDAKPKKDPGYAKEQAQIKALEKAIDRYAEKTAKGDFTTTGKPLGPDSRRVAQLKEIRDSRRSMYQVARDAGKPVLTPEQRYNVTRGKNIARQLAEAEARLKAGNFAPLPKKVSPALTKANLDARAVLEAKKNEIRRGEERYRLEHRTKIHKIWDGIRQTNLARTNIISSLDLSAPRQGLVYLLTSSTRIATNPGMILRPFRNMFQALASEKLTQRIDQEIKARNNRTNGVDKLAEVQFQDINNTSFTRGEENAHSILDEWAKTSYRGSSPIKTALKAVPLTGAKAVHMSNRAFATFLNTARAELLDHLLKVNFKDRAPTEAQIRSVGDMVNLSTGRGNMSHKVSSAIGFAGLWSPHLLVSRLQLLTGQPLVGAIARGEGRAAKIVAKEYARVIAGGYILYKTSQLFNEDQDKKSTSSDAGKIIRKGKGGDTRVDMWGGFQQQIVLAERFRPRKVLNKKTGKMEWVRQSTSIDGTTRNLSGRELLLTGAKFYRSKLRPDVALGADILLGENYKGDKTTVSSVAKSLVPIPLSMTELMPLLRAHGLSEAAALEAVQLFGAGVNNYSDDERAETKPSRQ